MIVMTEKEIKMVAWRNLDQLDAFHALQALEDQVVLKEVMLGDSGKERVEKYQVPMAEGLVYNFAAKKVNDRVLATLSDLARNFIMARSLIPVNTDEYFIIWSEDSLAKMSV